MTMKISLASILIATLFILSGCSSVKENNKTGFSSERDSVLTEFIFPYQEKHCHGSTIVELPNKDLLAAWFFGSGERTADDVKIMGSRYSKKTGLWCEPFVMADVPGFPDINPVLFIDSKSRLWLVWYTVMAYQWETSILKYRLSDNYMQESGAPVWTWQDVIHVKPDGSTPDGIGRNDRFVENLTRKYDEYLKSLLASGTIKADGTGPVTEEMWQAAVSSYMSRAKGATLIAGGTETNEIGEKIKTPLGFPLMRRIGWQTRNKPLIAGKRILLPLYSDGFDFSLIAITDDLGETWSFSEPIIGAGAVQPTLALCKDSSIVTYMRDNGPEPKRLMRSNSSDNGITWSTVEDSDVPNPGTAADIVVLKSGNWALVHNDVEEGRHRLSVWLSKDEGLTWPHRKILVNGPEKSEIRGHYPAIIQGADGTIHITYTNQIAGEPGKPSVKNIAHVALSEKWLMN